MPEVEIKQEPAEAKDAIDTLIRAHYEGRAPVLLVVVLDMSGKSGGYLSMQTGLRQIAPLVCSELRHGVEVILRTALDETDLCMCTDCVEDRLKGVS